jgi:rhodanese-related sulfurtransferase
MQHITVQQLKEKLNQNEDVFLLDVREEYEHEEFNVGGLLIPMDEVMSKVADIPTDKPVVVYCHRGIRSQIVIQRLEDKLGFTNLINLRGGIEKW